MKKRNRLFLGVVIIFVVVLAYFVLDFTIGIKNIKDIDYIEDYIEEFGMLGPIVYMIIMAMAIIISPIP